MVGAPRVALVASLVVGAASPAVADAIRSRGPLALEAPGDLVAGSGASAEVTLAAGEDVTLVASAGSIEAPLAGGDGRMRARFTVPGTRFPQVAIIAAVGADGAVRDWIAVPLAGNASVKVDTRAGSMVTLRIGDREFGPVAASRRGVATIPVVVPPGITDATAIALDPAGRRGESAVDLAVPSFQRVLSVCNPSGTHVELLAVESTGAPATETPVVTLSAASAGAATPNGPGWFTVAVDAGEAALDDVDVTATAGDDAATAGTCRLRLPPVAPTALRVELDRTSVVAGEGPIELRVTVDHPGRRRPAPVRVFGVTDFGSIELVPEHEPTRWRGRWSLPAVLGGRTTARMTIVGTTQDVRLETAATVTLAPEAVQTIDLEPPRPLRADGRARARLVARARDRHGNVVRVAALTARAIGALGSFEPVADGSLVATYVAPRSRSLRRDAIVVTDAQSGVIATAEIRIDPLDPLIRTDVRLGWIDNLGRLSAPVLAIDASAALPVPGVAADRVRAGVTLAAYHADFRAVVDDEGVDVTVTTLPIAGRMTYARSIGPVEVGGGGGLGAAIVDASTKSPSSGTRARTLVRPIYIAAVHGLYPLGRIALLGGVEYWSVRGDTGEVHGSVGGIVASGGVGARF